MSYAVSVFSRFSKKWVPCVAIGDPEESGMIERCAAGMLPCGDESFTVLAWIRTNLRTWSESMKLLLPVQSVIRTWPEAIRMSNLITR